MNKLEIDAIATGIFRAVNKFVNDETVRLKQYIDGKFDTAKEHTDQVEERLLKLRADAIDQTRDYVGREIEEAQARIQNKSVSADAGALEELPGIVKNLERRATRHADHLLGLEKRLRALEQNEK